MSILKESNFNDVETISEALETGGKNWYIKGIMAQGGIVQEAAMGGIAHHHVHARVVQHAQRGIKVGARFTLTQQNADDLEGLLDLMEELEVDKFYLSHLNYAGRGNVNRKRDAVARDLTALPAALQGGTVIVRREALRQWLWEKAEAWSIKKTAGAFARALRHYGHADDPHGALERMTDAETASLILHERGEHAASRLLGTGWEDRLVCSKKRRAEILMRAVRDNLADCLVTLPALIEREAWPSLWFWFANFDGMRRELWPEMAAFDFTKLGAGNTALQETVQRGAAHWEAVARRLLASDEAAVELLSHDTGALKPG